MLSEIEPWICSWLELQIKRCDSGRGNEPLLLFILSSFLIHDTCCKYTSGYCRDWFTLGIWSALSNCMQSWINFEPHERVSSEFLAAGFAWTLVINCLSEEGPLRILLSESFDRNGHPQSKKEKRKGGRKDKVKNGEARMEWSMGKLPQLPRRSKASYNFYTVQRLHRTGRVFPLSACTSRD